MMDLDGFKTLNDKYGHQAGDLVLVAVARSVMSHLRPYDEFFRYGGDEFLVVTPATDQETGYGAVERLREQIASMDFDVGDGRSVQVTASFGVTVLDAEATVEESIGRADRALYAAKAAGRNQSRIWYASMSEAPDH